MHGGDARRWLHDLVTTDVASLDRGRGTSIPAARPDRAHPRRPAGRRADDDGFWLFQAPDQPDHIGDALAPYVLSSDVRLDDLTDRRGCSHARDRPMHGADGLPALGARRRVATC